MPDRGNNLTTPRQGNFSPSLRLTHAREFEAVYANALRKTAPPLLVFFKVNNLQHPRLGLAVHRRLGIAVLRNTLKRRMRAAFAADFPTFAHADGRNFDIVVQFRTSTPPPTLEECRKALAEAVAAAWREIERRDRKSGAVAPEPPNPVKRPDGEPEHA